MKRFHAHVSVNDLDASVAFYSALFGAAPSVLKPDYAKWALDDPRVNFAISTSADNPARLSHLGIQAETGDELAQLHERLAAADIASRPQESARCCYAKSDKHWAADPAGIVWEIFHTTGQIASFGEDRGQADSIAPPAESSAAGCCAG